MFLSRSLPSILKKTDYKNNGGCVSPACSSFFPCKYISFVFQDCKHFICLLKFCTIFFKTICVLAKKSDFRCWFCEIFIRNSKRSMAKTKKGLCLLKTSSSYCTTLLWNCIDPICEHLPPFVTCVRNANDRNERGQ